MDKSKFNYKWLLIILSAGIMVMLSTIYFLQFIPNTVVEVKIPNIIENQEIKNIIINDEYYDYVIESGIFNIKSKKYNYISVLLKNNKKITCIVKSDKYCDVRYYNNTLQCGCF